MMMPGSLYRMAIATVLVACCAAVVIDRYGTRATQAADQPGSQQKTRVIRDVPYAKAASAENARRQTVDLYLPELSVRRPPLVVFIHGGFWALSDDEFQIGPAFANALVPRGVAVALVRYRLAPAYTHPAQVQDTAEAVAYLVQSAGRYGYDPKRVFLAGHSAGAHLAALLALDGTYLAAQRLTPRSLAGVVAFSGIYDLRPKPDMDEQTHLAVRQAFGENPTDLAAASPVSHLQAAAPPFLILGAESDFSGFLPDGKKFADALRERGAKVQQLVIPDHDHFSLVGLIGRDFEVRSLLLDFFKVQPLPAEMAVLTDAKRRWLDPPLTTLPFWRAEKLIRPYPVDRRLVEELALLYADMRYELLERSLDTYYAIDLFSYLESIPAEKVGRGDYLVISNFRNEKLFWDRREIAPYKPVIVIGLDDEKNLFRLGVFYRANREYTWKQGPRPPLMARPLGGFIHFLEAPPPELTRQAAYYGLTEDSFRFVNENPLAALKELPKPVYDALTVRNGCVYCHSFRGIGSQSYHVAASDNRRHGGLALPLESYPENVWRAFMFDQENVAKKIGASPNIVDEEARQPLYDLVARFRKSRNVGNK
jgi:acetyl esterase/lipase